MGKIKSKRKHHSKKPVTSILYRWAIDSGATHQEAVYQAKLGMARLARLANRPPEQKLEDNIKWIREREAKNFNLTDEQTNRRIECAQERYEVEMRVRAYKKAKREKDKARKLRKTAKRKGL